MPLAIAGRKREVDGVWSHLPVSWWWSMENAKSAVSSGAVTRVGGGPWNRDPTGSRTQRGDWYVNTSSSNNSNPVEYYNGRPGMRFSTFSLTQFMAMGATLAALPVADYFYCAAFIPRTFSVAGSDYSDFPCIVGQSAQNEGLGLSYGELQADGTCRVSAWHNRNGTFEGPILTAFPREMNVFAVCYRSGVIHLASDRFPIATVATLVPSNTAGTVMVGGAGNNSSNSAGAGIYEVVFAYGPGPGDMDSVIADMCSKYGVPFSR